jgi:DNA-binding NtrC family response regulator
MPHLLMVDNEGDVLSHLEGCLGSPELTISKCHTAKEAVRAVGEHAPDVVLMDVSLPDLSGLEAYNRMREKSPALPVIMMTAVAKTDTAIEAMKLGAFDYFVKPVDVPRLRSVVARALEVTRLSRAAGDSIGDLPPAGEVAADSMVGQSAAMQEVYKSIGQVASQDVAVLIVGESGTGKELAARAVWRHSRRADKPFVAINCAAIPEALLESELFGYEKAAFTGAQGRRLGKFEHANGGTVLLDEIADMSTATQAKVLRLIQEQRFERVGGSETVQTDVRVIAATNRNLRDMVAAGTFRQDLYYRVNGFTINLPPLRQRRGDIPLLTNFFIQRFNHEMQLNIRAVASDVTHWLELNSWPGNVRELQSAIRYAMIKAVGDVLTMGCFPPGSLVSENAGDDPANKHESFPGLERLARDLLRHNPGSVYRRLSNAVDRIAIHEALRYAKGNQLQAAAMLGISRTTLRAKLRNLGLSVEKQLSNDGRPK